MGFISGTSSVTVQAKLTDAGKKKLYESIENNSSGFITKFAIGDSDANYGAIDAGTDTLASGHVPEASEFKPSLRSFALYQGQYRPGIPVILIGGEYGSDHGTSIKLSIGANQQQQIEIVPTTEWPKDEAFEELYKLEVQNPGNLSESQMDSLFIVQGNTFQFNGNIRLSEVALLAGAYNTGNGTVVPLKVIGRTTNATIMYNIELVQ